MNGDGFDDLIVGAWGAESAGGENEGESYVVFGKASWAGTPSLDLASAGWDQRLHPDRR